MICHLDVRRDLFESSVNTLLPSPKKTEDFSFLLAIFTGFFSFFLLY